MQRERVCNRCSKSIAGQSVSCGECNRVFHPGCVKTYINTRSASVCCVTRLSAMPLTPKEAQASRVVDHRGAASPVVGGVAPHGAQLQTTDALLRSILSKIDESDKKFADRLDELDKKFTAAFEKSDERLTAFISRQEAVNADFARKLNQIPDVVKAIASHGERIAALEARSAGLLSTHGVDGESSAASRVSRTSDIIISGIPCSLAESSRELVGCVFRALGVPQLVSDVLETRDVAARDAPVTRDAASVSVSAVDQPDTAGRRRSLIVALKSREIRDHILKLMRGKRRLIISDVFSTSIPGNIFVNELLPSYTYNLLRQTRVRARQLSFKHVWSRDGRIFVRKDHGLPPISIASEADLAELQ